ncbi:MAG: MFS transporter [Acutalibacteraceae bacterium]
MASNNLAKKISSTVSDLRTYWNVPMPHRYMTFKEIAAYAGGGIGAYFIITVGMNLLVGTGNLIVGDAIGVDPMDMYVLYVISTLANIPLTAIRANMIDNSRNKAGKYRPFLLSMGIPTAIISICYVWFPYSSLYSIFGENGGYIAKCAIVMLFNLLLQFFYNFFYDAYTNLIHVLSPNTQERTDVLAIKSIVYSLAPSIVNIVMPLVAQWVANNNLYDIRVYRVAYPVFCIIGMALTVVVFGYTKEKIIQAKTHVIQVRFIDSFKSVAKNKYFWIIALAGWLGFLEGVYGNALNWSYTYGHVCNGTTMSVINLIIGNSSLWGMILAPFFVRAFGKKKVLLGTNFLNIVFILAILVDLDNIYWITFCIYMNWLVGAFEQITTPAIQADIRDFHQYRTGERVDGMFATVQTIGNMVTLVTSSVLPAVYKSFGVHKGNGYASPYDILDVDTGEPGLLHKVLTATIIMAAVGALLNVLPYFFYDLDERKQKSVVRVLKIRAMFEDYGNGVVNHEGLVEAIDIVRKAGEYEDAEPMSTDKKVYKAENADRKSAKKAYKAALEHNEEIEIAKFVFAELNKFETPLYQAKLEISRKIYNAGLAGLFHADMEDIKRELAEAKAMPTTTKEEKELRSFAVSVAQSKKASRKVIDKFYKSMSEFVQPDFSVLEKYTEIENQCDERLKEIYVIQAQAKKDKDSAKLKELSAEINSISEQKKDAQENVKVEINSHVNFNRAAKPYIDAEKMLKAQESYKHFEELAAKYDDAKAIAEAERQAQIDEQKKLEAEKAARTQQLKEEKAAAKMAKKNK